MAEEVVTLGEMMHEGAGNIPEDKVRAWVNPVHPAFVETKLAERLIDAGYDRLPSVYGVTEQRLIDGFKVKEGNAAQFTRLSACEKKT